jgi:mercuric ion transport protein
MKQLLEKIPSVGAIVAAAGCPVCFPVLAGVGSAFGLGALAAYESQFILLTQVFIVLSVVFAVVSYRRTQYKPSLLIAVLSGALFFFAWYVIGNTLLIYLGMVGIFATAMWNLYIENRVKKCAA